MIQDQSEGNSERGKDKNFYLSEEEGLTLLLAMTWSFEDCDWLVVQEGNKRALLRVGYIISLHVEITGKFFPVLPYSLSLSLSLSHTHTHTHTHIIYVYIFFIFYLPCCHTLRILQEMNSDTIMFWKCCNRPKSSLLESCIFPVAKYVNVVNVVITSISGAMAFLRGVGDVSVSLIRSVTNMIPARSNVYHLVNSLSCIVCNTFLLPLQFSSIFSTAKETLKPLKSPRSYS